MKVNWQVRIKNKMFWLSIIPAVLLLAQAIAAVFGYTLDVSAIQGKLLAVIEAAFLVLTIAGVIADPTTVGLFDSARALSYDAPHDDMAGLR